MIIKSYDLIFPLDKLHDLIDDYLTSFFVHSPPRQHQRTMRPSSLPPWPSPPPHRVSPPQGSTASPHNPLDPPPWISWEIWGVTHLLPQPLQLRPNPQAVEGEKVCSVIQGTIIIFNKKLSSILGKIILLFWSDSKQVNLYYIVCSL